MTFWGRMMPLNLGVFQKKNALGLAYQDTLEREFAKEVLLRESFAMQVGLNC